MILLLWLSLSMPTYANDPPAAIADTLERLVTLGRKRPRAMEDLEFVVRHIHDAGASGPAEALVPAARNQLALILRDQPELVHAYLGRRAITPTEAADWILSAQQNARGLALALRRHDLLSDEAVALAFARPGLSREHAELAVELVKLGVRHPAIEDVLVTELENVRLDAFRMGQILRHLAPAGIVSDRAVAALRNILTPPFFSPAGTSREHVIYRAEVVNALGRIPTRASLAALKAIEKLDTEGDGFSRPLPDTFDLISLARETRLKLKREMRWSSLRWCGWRLRG